MPIDWNKIRGNTSGATTTESSKVNWDKIRSGLPTTAVAEPPKVASKKLPDFLGGGEYLLKSTYPRPQSERGYPPGLETQVGQERDHNIPFSLGGTNTKQNVAYKPIDIAKQRDEFIADLNRQIKAGKISRQEAIVKANSFYSDVENKPSVLDIIKGMPGQLGKIYSKAGGDIKSTVESITKSPELLKFPVTKENITKISSVPTGEGELGRKPLFPSTTPYSILGAGQALRQKNVPPEAKEEVASLVTNIAASMGLTAPEAKIISKIKSLLPKTEANIIPKKASLFTKAKEALAPIKAVDEESQAIYKNWVSRNLVGKELANKEARVLSTIPEKEGLSTILKYEAGEVTPFSQQIKNTFDNLFKEANERMGNISYRPNYIPQMYNNTREEVHSAVVKYLKDSGVADDVVKNYAKGSDIPEEIATRLRLTPGFSGERLFPSYEISTKYGLEPRFTHPAQLAAAYRETLEGVSANRELVKELVNKGKLVTSRAAVPGYNAPVDLAFSPRGLYAEPKLAKALNNLSRNEDSMGFGEMVASKLSKTSKFMQEVALSAGFPKTDVNFFSIGQLIKNLTARTGQATTRPLGAFRSAGKDIAAFIRANSDAASIKWFESKASVISKMAEQGIDISGRVGQYRDMFKNMVASKTWAQHLGQKWDNVFQKKTFASFMPQLYINTFEETYKTALKQGMADDTASRLAGEVTKAFHGLTDNVARAQGTQDALSAVFFAPRFREGIINTLWNSGKSLTSQLRNPAFKKSRELAIGIALTYAGYNYLNHKLNGNYTWDNETGREFSLRIPLGDDNVMYVEFMPSFLSLPRNLGLTAIALSKLDLKTASQKASSLLSMPIQIGTQIINNEDYFGNPIYKDTDTRLEKIGKIAQYLGLRANHPYLRLINDYIASKSDKEFKKPIVQSLIEAAEFPLKFNSLDRISRQEFYEAIDKISTGNAEARKRIQPLYEQAQQLIKEGKDSEADQIVNNLSDEDWAVYKTIKASDKRYSTSVMEQKMFATYKKIQELLSSGKQNEADNMVNSMSDEEYKAYDLLRKRLNPNQ
jgi:hypothetical protein